MPPRMRTHSTGQPAAKSLGGGTGVRVGRGGRGRGYREGNDERVDDLNEMTRNLLPAMLAQLGNQGNVRNQNGNVVNENIQENGGVVVLTRWIEKMESVQDMSGCSIDQKVKYTAGSFMGKALTWWNSQIYMLSREVAVSISWNDFKIMMTEEFCPIHVMQKMETELRNHAMVGAGHAAYTDRFHDLARLVPHLVTLESRMIERYLYGLAPQICGIVAATEPKTIQKVVQISGTLTDEAVRNRSIKKVGKRGNEERIRVLGPSVPPATPTMHPEEGRVAYALTVTARVIWQGIIEVIKPRNQARGYGNSCWEQRKLARIRTLYEIKIASGQLVEIDKREIICHEKVARIPLPDGKVLRVVEERPEEKARFFMGVKKQEEIVVVRDFLSISRDDLSVPPIQEIEFQIELIPGATPVAKSPYF
ncbi:putative reverse transcriptase domain-containing protein [Tanacetum coccineum]